MDLLDTEQKSISESTVSTTANTRLSGSWLIIAHTVWLVLVVSSVGLFVVGLPMYYQQLQRACVGAVTCNLDGALSVQGLQSLVSSGFSVTEYAALYTIFYALFAAISCGVGLLIFWRRSDDWLALLAAFFLVMTNITPTGSNTTYALALTYPVFALPFSLLSFLGWVSLFGFLLLFPNGRLIPRWMGLILLLVIIYEFFNSFPSPTSPFDTNWPGWLYLLINGVIFVALIYSQIYRYRRVSTPVQCLQTKWIVLAVTVVLGVLIGLYVIGFFIPYSSIQQYSLVGVIVNLIFPIVTLLVPLSIGFSILRYRLYDIDVLINRTLVYGTLTALLVLLYIGLIFALQFLLQGVFKQNNDVAIVVSTLVIAALFQPLRHRLQQVIDRRFYRRKYDAARTLAQFSTSLRNEVDLSQLRESLVAVVEETMQPTHISLWVRSAQQDVKHVTAWTRNPSPPHIGSEE